MILVLILVSDEMAIQLGVRQDRFLPMKTPDGGGIVEIIDLCDTESHYSAYQSMDAAYQQQWGSERIVRIHPLRKVSLNRRIPSKN